MVIAKYCVQQKGYGKFKHYVIELVTTEEIKNLDGEGIKLFETREEAQKYLDNLNEDSKKIDKPRDFVPIHARLPVEDLTLFKQHCDKLKQTVSERIRDLILKDINRPLRFLSGINKIRYNKINNSFSWIVQLDSGEEIEVLKNLSDSFLKNLQNEIQDAIKQRNSWVHQIHSDSVDVPGELIGEKDE